MSCENTWLFLRQFGIWFIDLDDTLMWNSTTYNQPVMDFVNYLTKIFENRIPSLGIVAQMHESIDYALGKEVNPRTGKLYAFGRDRFPDSLAMTYKHLCTEGFGIFNETNAEHCRKIGMTAFYAKNYQKLGLVPGAEEVLNFLAEKNHQLVLVTKGDDWVQRKKIDALGLGRWFSDVRIVEQKSWRVYLDIISSLRELAPEDQKERFTTANTVVVGNSFSSDIAPALTAGICSLFIPCATWKAESIDPGELTQDAQSRLVTFKEIKEIISWYNTSVK